MACSCWQGTFHCALYLERGGGRVRRCWWWQRSLGDRKKFGRDTSAGWRIGISISFSHLIWNVSIIQKRSFFQTLITRQSYGQQMRYYNIKQPALPISVRNSERIPGLSLTGDSELTVWEIFFISAADKICHWWSENSVQGEKRHLCL